jgi:quinol monooxygenase YgiN
MSSSRIEADESRETESASAKIDEKIGKIIMSTPAKIIAILVARRGMAEELRALLDGMVIASRTEPGNLQYNLWRDHADAGRFVLEELYTDDEAVAAHRATPHFEKYLSKINDLAERTAIMLDPLEVA